MAELYHMFMKIIVVALLSTTPWGEWAIAIPAGLLMQLPFGLTVAAAFAGNLIPVLVITVLGDKIRNRLSSWYEKRQYKAGKYIIRYGIPGLILLAPLTVGVYVSSIIASVSGFTARRSIFLHFIALTLWGSVIYGLYLLGVEAWNCWR